METNNVLKICPPEDSMKDCKTDIKCPIVNCDKVVFSSGSLRMHLTRSHGVSESDSDDALKRRIKVDPKVYKEYHCPRNDCLYNINSERHFTNMAGLKQHFLKVHAEKKFKCSKCGYGFGMEKDKKRHESHCGMTFTCTSCQCTYVSVEALRTHCNRTQHQIPEMYTKREKVDKKKAKDKNNNKKPTNSIKDVISHQNNLRIPVILLPVPVTMMNQMTNQNNSIPTQANIRENVNTNKSEVSTLHLLDHDYLPNSSADSNKQNQTQKDTGSQSLNFINNVGKYNLVPMLSSAMQTVSEPRKEIAIKSKDTTTNIAQTQTLGNCILTQAMTSANIPVESSSVGTQITPKEKCVETQTGKTPKSKRGNTSHKSSSPKERIISRKKLYNKSASDLSTQKTSKTKGRQSKKESLVNPTKSTNVSDTIHFSNTGLSSSQYMSYNSSNTACSSVQTLNQNEMVSTGSQFSDVQGNQVQNSYSSTNGDRISMSTSISDFDFMQTIGVQTSDFQDFLLAQNDSASHMDTGTSSIGINTENSQVNKCVGNDPSFSIDSHVQTVDFDFLANSPDPPPSTEAIHTQTQTVDLDIESIESLVSSIQTQTFDSDESLTDVQTQTKNSLSVDTQTFSETLDNNTFLSSSMETQTSNSLSVDTQTLSETLDRNTYFSSCMETQTTNSLSVNTQTLTETLDCNTFVSSSMETQTYDEFIELLSSGTQTLDYGFFQDAPLSLIDIETQTGIDKNPPLSFGTQTSVVQTETESKGTNMAYDFEINKGSRFCHDSSTSMEGEGNTHNGNNNYQSEQMEFLVSEVLEMIPVASGRSHIDSRSSAIQVDSTDIYTQSKSGINMENMDNHTQTNLDFNSNTDSHTQTALALDTSNNETQTRSLQELTSSETQTVLQRGGLNIDLTDSHTQTTWKELNELLAELDR
ncbi:ATM interactor-like [Mytilus trossulus]|uniref:ATM interactor-like n=1 Tax=Mytilus trossulus TaxID=6551 RepID=UPI003007B295